MSRNKLPVKFPMSEFSVVSSIVAPNDIACFVQREYGLAMPTTCRLLKTGINHTYRLDSGTESYIFRLYSYQWRTYQEIIEELELLLDLKVEALQVSYPIADCAGNFVRLVPAPEGERFAVLFSFAKGKKILQYGEETHFEIGKLMGQLHRMTLGRTQSRISYTAETLLHGPLGYLGNFLSDEIEEMKYLKNLIPILEQELAQADISKIRQGIVHLDIWFDNLNISNETGITLFDFDFCGNGWLCMDIAYYIMQVYNTEKNETERASKTDAFFKGYESICEISPEERRLLPILGVCIFVFYLGTQCQRFENWSNTFINEVYLKRFITVYIKGYYEAQHNPFGLSGENK